MKRFRKMFSTLTGFVTYGLWQMPLDRMPRAKSFLYRNLRIIVIAFRGFREDECRLRASALTYYSLMAIVPVLAMAFAIAKGFGFEHLMQGIIARNFSENEEIATTLVSIANTLIEEARGGLIAGIGLAVLIWAVVEVFSHIEHSFNEIWEQKKSRSLARKFSDYLSMLIIVPIFILLAASATVYVTSRVHDFSHQSEFFGYVGPVLIALMRWLPVVMIWILFTVIYMVMPNTRVRFVPALVGGLIAGTLYQLTQVGYFIVQIELIDINAVYGSFAVLPLLFLWLRASWIILLFGAEISYAHQNVKKFEYEMESAAVSHRVKRIVALMITRQIVKRFASGTPPLTESELASELNLPLKIVRQLTWELCEAGIIAESSTKNEKEFGFLPALDIHLMSIQFVMDKLDQSGPTLAHKTEDPVYAGFNKRLNEFSSALGQNSHNKLLIEI